MNTLFKPLAIASLALTCITPMLHAQRGGVRIASGPHFGIQASGRSTAFLARPFGRGSGTLFLGDPFLLDYGGDQTYPIQSPTREIVVVPAAPAPQEPAPVKPEPLMIEWRGDRYVRASSSQPASPDYAGPAGQMTRRTQAQRLPAVLVFRNGSRVEVDNYTIVGDFLYTNADRWVTGAWNKRIDLATLDIPSTLQANQQRGVAFNLPSSPNEVMVRP